jgi:hypothetical protein
LRDTLLNQKILLQDFGDKFTVAVTPLQTNLLAAIRPLSARVANKPLAQLGNGELVGPGPIRYLATDVSLALGSYANLSERTALRPSILPDIKITLLSQTACRRDEAAWMYETALRLAGLAVETRGDKFVYVGPPELAGRVPQFPPDAAKGETKFTARIVSVNTIPLPRKPRGPPPPKNPPPPSHHLQLLKLYSEVTGRVPIVAGPEPVDIKVIFETQTGLTAGEMIYALESVAALNNLKFDLVGEKGVRLVLFN